MNRPLRLLVSAVALLCASVATPAASASNAAQGEWQLDYSWRMGAFDYTMKGHVSGQRGNAHSGQFWYDSSDGEVQGEMLDWRCPAGVTPPTSRFAESACTLLVVSGLEWQDVYPDRDLPVSVGRVGANVRDTFEVWSAPLAGGPSALVGSTKVDLRFRAHGAITRTVQVDGDYKYVGDRAALAVKGRLGWLKLSDRRVTVTPSEGYAERQYVRIAGS